MPTSYQMQQLWNGGIAEVDLDDYSVYISMVEIDETRYPVAVGPGDDEWEAKTMEKGMFKRSLLLEPDFDPNVPVDAEKKMVSIKRKMKDKLESG